MFTYRNFEKLRLFGGRHANRVVELPNQDFIMFYYIIDYKPL